jgi:hypothetical protein
VAAVDTPVKCFKCGYALRGLSEGGVCPECGSSIFWTLTQLRERSRVQPRYVKWMWLILACAHLILGPADIVGLGVGASDWSLFVALLVGGTLMYAGIGLAIGWWLKRFSR